MENKPSRRGFLGVVAAIGAVPSVMKGPLPQPKTVVEQVERLRPSYRTMSLVNPGGSSGYLLTHAYRRSDFDEHKRLMQEADRKRNKE